LEGTITPLSPTPPLYDTLQQNIHSNKTKKTQTQHNTPVHGQTGVIFNA